MKKIRKWQMRIVMVLCFGCLLALVVRGGYAQSDDAGLSDASRMFTPEIVEPNGLTTVDVTLEGAYCSTTDDNRNVTGVDIALVVDRSGSMSGEPLELAIGAGKGFLKRASSEIEGTERIGVISFDDTARTDADIGSPIVETATALDALQTGGTTSISGGIDEAVRALAVEPIETNAQAMIVLSDGFHNEGREPDLAAADACNAGIQLFTVGLGDSVEPSLETIPCNGGRYFFAPTPQDLNDIYQLIANEILGVVATDVIVRETVPAGLTVGYVSDSGVVQEDENVIEWRIPLLEDTSRTFSYQVSGNVVGGYDFAGDVAFEGCAMADEALTIITSTLTVEEGAGSSEPITETVVEAGEIDTSDTADFIVLTQDELSCKYDWVDVSRSPSFFQLADDQFREISLSDFPFMFGGEFADSVTVSNNGGVFFGTPEYLHWDNQPLSEMTTPAVFPLWDDWLGGTVFATFEGDAPNRTLVIEWTNREHYWLRGDTVTFQMILTEGTSDIKIQYQDVDYAGNELWTTPPPLVYNGGSATIGIVPASGNVMQIAHNQPNAVMNENAFCLYAPGDIEIVTGVAIEGVCSDAQEVDVLIGQEVTWCYQVTNTTAAPATLEGIADTQFGVITADTLTLVPGESTFFTRTASMMETVVHETLWSLSGDSVFLDNAPWGTVTLGGQLQQETRVNVIPAGLRLNVTAALSPEECGLYNSLTAPLGSTVITCYEVQNTHPAVTYTTHSLEDSVLGTLLDDELLVLPFGETVLFTATGTAEMGVTTHSTTWTGNGTEVASDTVTIITESQPEPLQCGQPVRFGLGLPSDWSLEGDSDLNWVPNVSASCGQPNYAGSGTSMCIMNDNASSSNALIITNLINVDSYQTRYGEVFMTPYNSSYFDEPYDILLRFNVAHSATTLLEESFGLYVVNGAGSGQGNLLDTLPVSTFLQPIEDDMILTSYTVSLSSFIGGWGTQLGFAYMGNGSAGSIQLDSVGMACGRAPISVGDPFADVAGWAQVDEPFQPTSITIHTVREIAADTAAHTTILLLLGMVIVSVGTIIRPKND